MNSICHTDTIDDYVTPRSDSAISTGDSDCFSIDAKQSSDDRTAQKALLKLRRECDASVRSIHQQALDKSWLENFHDDIYISTSGLGAFVRRPDGSYSSTTQDQTIHSAVEAVRPLVALTFSTNAVSLLLNQIPFGQKHIDVYGDYMIAIIDSIEDIVRPDFSIPDIVSHCICRKEHFILIWSTSVSLLYQEAHMLESLLAVITRSYLSPNRPFFTSNPFEQAFELDLPRTTISQADEDAMIRRPVVEPQVLTVLGLEQSTLSRSRLVGFLPVDYDAIPGVSAQVDHDLKPVSKRMTWDGLQSFGRRFSITEALFVS